MKILGFNVHIKSLQRMILSFINATRNLLNGIIGLVINYLLIHYKPELFLDSYVKCYTVLNLLLVFNNLIPKDYLIKAFSKEPSKTKQIFADAFFVKLFITILFIPLLFLWPMSLGLKLTLAFLLVLKAFGSLTEPVTQQEKKFKQILLLDFILGIGIIAILIYDTNQNNVNLFLSELILVEIIRSVFLFIYYRQHLSFHFNPTSIQLTILKSLPFFGIAIFGFAASRADLYVLGYLLSANDLNRYYILLNLLVFCQIIFNSIIGTFATTIFRYDAKTFLKFERYVLKIGLIFSILGSLSITIMYYFYYKILLDTSTSILLTVNLFSFCLTLIGIYKFTRTNNQNRILKIIVIVGLLNFTLSALLIKNLGFNGAILSNTLSSLISGLIFYYIPIKLVHLNQSKNHI